MAANTINHEAWVQSCMGFIRERGLEQEFTDWCGGWKCPVRPSVVSEISSETWSLKTVPTSVGHCHKIEIGDELVACVYVDHCKGPEKAIVAAERALLISISPLLLEAAEFALPALEEEASHCGPDDPIRVAAYALRTAIAKARGLGGTA